MAKRKRFYGVICSMCDGYFNTVKEWRKHDCNDYNLLDKDD